MVLTVWISESQYLLSSTLGIEGVQRTIATKEFPITTLF